MALTDDRCRVGGRPATGIAPFSNDAPSAGWSTVSVGASIDEERDRDEQVERLLGLLAGVGIDRADVELVAPAAQVDVGRPLPVEVAVTW